MTAALPQMWQVASTPHSIVHCPDPPEVCFQDSVEVLPKGTRSVVTAPIVVISGKGRRGEGRGGEGRVRREEEDMARPAHLSEYV